ncbi:MAG: M48 family metalloprotease [Streptosporangiaceae bacterium]
MRGVMLRAAEGAAAVAGLATAVIVLMAGFALIGVGVAGAGGAVAGLAVAAVLAAVGYARGDRMALAAMDARPVSEVEQPELYRLVRELSTAGRQPVPRLYVSPAEQPNSFTVGRSPRSARVCCSQGLLRLLDQAELRGVLGHELAHVSGHDILAGSMSAGLAAVVTFPAALARFARPGLAPARAGSGPGVLEASMLLALGPVAAVLIRLAVSPEREYRADATSARLTGDPLALASALRKVEAGVSGSAELALAADGRRSPVGHLMIVSPFRAAGLARIFPAQPPARERVRRLEALAGYRR